MMTTNKLSRAQVDFLARLAPLMGDSKAVAGAAFSFKAEAWRQVYALRDKGYVLLLVNDGPGTAGEGVLTELGAAFVRDAQRVPPPSSPPVLQWRF